MLVRARIHNIRAKGNSVFIVLRESFATLQAVAFKSFIAPPPQNVRYFTPTAPICVVYALAYKIDYSHNDLPIVQHILGVILWMLLSLAIMICNVIPMCSMCFRMLYRKGGIMDIFAVLCAYVYNG